MSRPRLCLVPSLLCVLAALSVLTLLNPSTNHTGGPLASALVSALEFLLLGILVALIAFNSGNRPAVGDHQLAMSAYAGVATMAVLTWWNDTTPLHMVATFVALAATVVEAVRWYCSIHDDNEV